MSDQRERWTGWLALSTAVMAVFAALTTLYVGKYSSRAVMMLTFPPKTQPLQT